MRDRCLATVGTRPLRILILVRILWWGFQGRVDIGREKL